MNWKKLTSFAYTPYSGKPECCIVKGKSGILYTGVLIENVSHPLTITAEQAAFSSCLGEVDYPVVLYYPASPRNSPQFWLDEFTLITKISGDFPEGELFNPLKPITGEPKKHLLNLKKRAVIPNSEFPVSALLYIDEGSVVEGVNIEFSVWNWGLCAERVALAKALSAGYRRFEKMSIYVPKSDFASPCGACRQVISEWMHFEFIDLYHGNDTLSSYPAKDFLPYALKTSALNKSPRE